MLLYPVYALLFAQSGLSTAQISSLLAIWSITSFTLEIPSGVWADATSRRVLLVVAPVLQAIGYALWIVAPSYPAFAVGFLLWGTAGALQSGALEALVYEELDRLGAAARYPHLIGRATAIGTVASMVAIGLAAPVFAQGGFSAVGVASVLACVAAAVVATTFPEHRSRTGEGHGAAGFRGYAAVLEAGIAELRSSPALRAALLLVPAVAATWGALDEYLPLLATEKGVADETVPVLFLVVYVGVALGGLLGGPASRLSRRALAGLIFAAATALALGALSGVALGFTLIAVAFCAFQAVQVVVEARLQDAINGSARSTVTSLAGLITEVVVLAVFAAYAAGSAFAGHATLFACCASVYVGVAFALALRSRTMADAREWFEQLRDLQLEQNPATVAALEQRGIAEDTPVRLEFFYLAPGEPEARSLVTFLRGETDYDVRAFERREGMDENTPWLVVGLTQPTPLSLDLVNEWTEWMVAAGAEQGPCAFDGWAAQTIA